MSCFVRTATLLAASAWMAGCASSGKAASVPLDVPAPPPLAAVAPVALVEEPPAERPAAAVPPEPAASAPASDSTAGRARSSTASAAPAPAPAAPSAQPAATTPAPAIELRPSGPAGAGSASAQQVRDIVTRTVQKLNGLDRRSLSAGKQNDYDAARRFLSQADSAVRSNDLLLAQSLAEKAEALADGLR